MGIKLWLDKGPLHFIIRSNGADPGAVIKTCDLCNENHKCSLIHKRLPHASERADQFEDQPK